MTIRRGIFFLFFTPLILFRYSHSHFFSFFYSFLFSLCDILLYSGLQHLKYTTHKNFITQELEELWAFRDLLVNITQMLSGCCIAELMPLLDLPGVKKVSLSSPSFMLHFMYFSSLSLSSVHSLCYILEQRILEICFIVNDEHHFAVYTFKVCVRE